MPGSALSNITRNLFPYCVRVLISPIEKCTTGQISNWGAIQAQLHCVLSFGDDLDDGGFYSVEDSPLGNAISGDCSSIATTTLHVL